MIDEGGRAPTSGKVDGRRGIERGRVHTRLAAGDQGYSALTLARGRRGEVRVTIGPSGGNGRAASAVVLGHLRGTPSAPLDMTPPWIRSSTWRTVLILLAGPRLPDVPRHTRTEVPARQETVAVGLHWMATPGVLPSQHFVVFHKP